MSAAKVGDTVLISGVVSKPELNGVRGVVVADRGDRMAVQLPGSADTVALKLGSMEVVSPSSSAAAGGALTPRTVKQVLPATPKHWVGDGFNVHPVFGRHAFTNDISPFLMFDYGAPKHFPPTKEKLGVGQHPHRGFETVTIAWQGEVEHSDSLGNTGVIKAGDVQWMTAGRGILHEEFHSRKLAETGGTFEMCQLWVNLPKGDKMTKPRYQPITKDQIPVVPITAEDEAAGRVSIIAGEYRGQVGAAKTWTALNLWDVVIEKPGVPFEFPIPESYNTMVFVRKGAVQIGGSKKVGPQGVAMLNYDGGCIQLQADTPKTQVLIMAGEPINEPICARGPMVMNTEAQIQQAFKDFYAGKLGR